VRRTSRALVVVSATIVLTLSGGPLAVTVVGGGSPGDGGARGADALARASEAALAATGDGRVTGTEIGDEDGGENGCYEVEVTLRDGREVDVHLDASFGLVPGPAEAEDDGGAD
jgi:hypothetical protein